MNMTISQVARLAGIGVETVRFYEREGLLDQPARPDSGYRHYPPEAVKRLQFIRRAKELGFSLKEIGELLALSAEPTSSCALVKRQAQAKIDEVEGKIADLLRMKRVLGQVAERCSGDGSQEHCPILDALSQENHMETAEIYRCPICHLHFREKSQKLQCEAWCRTHNSCHLSIASQSLEACERTREAKQVRKEHA